MHLDDSKLCSISEQSELNGSASGCIACPHSSAGSAVQEFALDSCGRAHADLLTGARWSLQGSKMSPSAKSNQLAIDVAQVADAWRKGLASPDSASSILSILSYLETREDQQAKQAASGTQEILVHLLALSTDLRRIPSALDPVAQAQSRFVSSDPCEAQTLSFPGSNLAPIL